MKIMNKRIKKKRQAILNKAISESNVYALNWDIKKCVEANKEEIAKGFFYVDDLAVLDKLYEKLKSIMKLYQIGMMFITPQQSFLGSDVYVVIDNTLDINIEELEDKLDNYFEFDFDKDLREIINKLGFSGGVSTEQDYFVLRFNKVLLTDKETLERSKTMSRMELNKTYKSLDLYSSNFVRLINE